MGGEGPKVVPAAQVGEFVDKDGAEGVGVEVDLKRRRQEDGRAAVACQKRAVNGGVSQQARRNRREGSQQRYCGAGRNGASITAQARQVPLADAEPEQQSGGDEEPTRRSTGYLEGKCLPFRSGRARSRCKCPRLAYLRAGRERKISPPRPQ